MYSDKKKKNYKPLLLLLLVLAAAALIWSFAGGSREKLNEESCTAIREAIRRSALQCFVVEGVYPPNLTYLEENYGLQVNTEDFYITYDAFASNLPPDIKVTTRSH